MARDRSPKVRTARKFGEPIFGFSKAFEKRKYPPGQHGLAKKRKTVSEYAVQLQEKQKAKAIYGLLERQFRKLYVVAHHKQGVTGSLLLQLLESRFDNVVYRLGLAPSRRAARQLISHKHLTVNGKLLNIPSYHLKSGDIIGIREKSKDVAVIKTSLNASGNKYPWLDWNNAAQQGTFIAVPEREQIPENIKEQLIVELYSK